MSERPQLSEEEKEEQKKELIKYLEEAIDSSGFFIVIAKFVGKDARVKLYQHCYSEEALQTLSEVNKEVVFRVLTNGIIFGS